MDDFSKKLLDWYDGASRKLPWRMSRDPYAILVSEIMLQQTQVKTVIPYYHRFLEKFPTPHALAQAPEEDLLKMWQGLGYYRRARNLQIAAKQIVEEHNGIFPKEKANIDALKGVGAYTSAAVASIAFGEPWACVDGNVIRVISRMQACDDDVGLAKTKRYIQEQAQEQLSLSRPGDFNQAMMELGATVCTPRNPGCLTCGVNDFCQTFQSGEDPHTRPVKAKKAAASKVTFKSLFLYCGNRLLLARRPAKGLMAGMWELPAQHAQNYLPWDQLFNQAPTYQGEIKPVVHKFTHLHATYEVSVYSHPSPLEWLKTPDGYAETRWVGQDDFKRLPITKVLTKLLPILTGFLKGESSCRKKHSGLPGMQTTN